MLNILQSDGPRVKKTLAKAINQLRETWINHIVSKIGKQLVLARNK